MAARVQVYLIAFGDFLYEVASDSHDKGDYVHIRVYMYLVMVLLQSEAMWRSFVQFFGAVVGAASVIWLFFCSLLIITSMGLVLLQGKFATDDYYTDQQFAAPGGEHGHTLVD